MAEQRTTTMPYNAAMGLALVEEMRRDERIFVLGQGVATGGWFGAEKGLAAEFGTERVIDSGIAEAFEAGVAAGAAIAGMKPVINMGFGDFALIAGDEIFQKLGKWRYMHGLDVAMTAVVIFPIGVMGGAGPEHSSCPEVLGMHFPGLKVVVPSTAADAKGLMTAALREPNPVLFHSVNSLGFQKGEVPLDPDFIVPIGKGIVHALYHGDVTEEYYGKRYTTEFHQVFHRLAQQHALALIPFLLEGLPGEESYFQEDGLHPTAKAQPLIRDRVWESLRPLLQAGKETVRLGGKK